MKKARTLILVGMVVFSCFAGWLAQSGARDPQPTTTPAPQASEPAVSQSTAETHAGTVTSRHSMMIGRVELAYTATAGFLQLHDQAGKLQANMFYVSYARDGQPPSARPITFAFNGGPGAASLWLHLGALGPKRVVLADDGKAPAKSLTLVDNEDTWLTFTDLVFIDPVARIQHRRAGSRRQAILRSSRGRPVRGRVHSLVRLQVRPVVVPEIPRW